MPQLFSLTVENAWKTLLKHLHVAVNKLIVYSDLHVCMLTHALASMQNRCLLLKNRILVLIYVYVNLYLYAENTECLYNLLNFYKSYVILSHTLWYTNIYTVHFEGRWTEQNMPLFIRHMGFAICLNVTMTMDGHSACKYLSINNSAGITSMLGGIGVLCWASN